MIPTMRKIGLLIMTLTAAPASAQLIAAKTHTIAMGHHHVMVEDMEKNISFWKSLGGETVSFYGSIGIRFPNVLIFFREQQPTAGTNGAVVNHVGLQFKDLRPLVERLRNAATPIITDEVVGATMDVDDDGLTFNEAAGSYLAFALAPNGTRVELYENKELERAVANHHIHFYGPEVDAMKAWYVENLGAEPGQRAGMEAADLGGVNLTFSPADTKLAPMKGRALDHIVFEVEGLETLCKKLEAKGFTFESPYEWIPERKIAHATLIDPWGTQIEFTEGLDGL